MKKIFTIFMCLICLCFCGCTSSKTSDKFIITQTEQLFLDINDNNDDRYIRFETTLPYTDLFYKTLDGEWTDGTQTGPICQVSYSWDYSKARFYISYHVTDYTKVIGTKLTFTLYYHYDKDGTTQTSVITLVKNY